MKCKFFLAAALFAVACSAKADVLYGQNLVVNGNAEAGVSGWTGYTGYDMVQSVDYGNNWVLPTQPGPVDRGNKMFAGFGQYAVASQTLDFGVATTRNSSYSLSGWLGGWTNQGDNALFYVQFLDAGNNEIGNAAIGPVTPQDRGNQTGLFYRESVGIMPAGTSKLSFWLSMERLVSSDNDGYADNLSFIATSPVPEPGMASMFLLGLGMLAGVVRRNRRASTNPL
ncbi:PEP-CTERM sorting domain-containing protein [Duganella vulcania]|uniref:PEP-CTERM sorting domain-containing protein n=1 Tax=Duganella vulcania TaxID=2692166 RepID=A0A845GQK8_9BURK|nr:PEP-CTERM sorting domain-containing protein [Duganella vulcania]MYM95468.1 PEP-CTERM sorting domain-containing protein [Duganella vulcania]